MLVVGGFICAEVMQTAGRLADCCGALFSGAAACCAGKPVRARMEDEAPAEAPEPSTDKPPLKKQHLPHHTTQAQQAPTTASDAAAAASQPKPAASTASQDPTPAPATATAVAAPAPAAPVEVKREVAGEVAPAPSAATSSAGDCAVRPPQPAAKEDPASGITCHLGWKVGPLWGCVRCAVRVGGSVEGLRKVGGLVGGHYTTGSSHGLAGLGGTGHGWQDGAWLRSIELGGGWGEGAITKGRKGARHGKLLAGNALKSAVEWLAVLI